MYFFHAPVTPITSHLSWSLVTEKFPRVADPCFYAPIEALPLANGLAHGGLFGDNLGPICTDF
jgi:hypothetical protein